MVSVIGCVLVPYGTGDFDELVDHIIVDEDRSFALSELLFFVGLVLLVMCTRRSSTHAHDAPDLVVDHLGGFARQ